MKKLLHNITGWLVKKTKYELQLPLPIQPIIIKPNDFQHFKAQKARRQQASFFVFSMCQNAHSISFRHAKIQLLSGKGERFPGNRKDKEVIT